MVQIREVGADAWQAMRDIRLAALRDAPDAFASTYEREAAFAEADWQRWIAGGGNFLAYVPELGIAPAGPGAGAFPGCTCGWPRTMTRPGGCMSGAGSRRPRNASRCRPTRR